MIHSSSYSLVSRYLESEIYISTFPNAVAVDPTIMSLALVSATAVRVEWSQPSGGASVTGYVVHYSNNGVTNSVSGLSSYATSHEITGLTIGHTYSISVEATSEHLSGKSEPMTIVVCKFSVIINV